MAGSWSNDARPRATYPAMASAASAMWRRRSTATLRLRSDRDRLPQCRRANRVAQTGLRDDVDRATKQLLQAELEAR